MPSTQLQTDNPELLHYIAGKLHITILGGIKFTGLDRLKVTLKVVNRDNSQKVFRHNVDLYNSIQTGQLVERAADYLDIPTATVNETIDQLTTALEEYRAAHLESLKPKPQEVKQLTEAERKAALQFLKTPNLIKQTAEANPKRYCRRRNQCTDSIPDLYIKETKHTLTPNVFRSIRNR